MKTISENEIEKLDQGAAEYSGTFHESGNGIKKETPLQRNINDLRYISRFVKKINNSTDNPSKEITPERSQQLLIKNLNPNEEQHPDPASRPRRTVPLSTMIRLTNERRRKIEEDEIKAMLQI